MHPRDEPKVATIPSTPTLRQSIVALPLLSFLLVLRSTLQMCILSSPINSLSIRFWTTSPNAEHLPNSSVTAHRLRLVNMSSRFFDPYTFPLGRVSHISSIITLPNISTRTSNDCATPSLTALGLQRSYTWLLCLMYVCFLPNNTWCEAVDDIPICMSMGSTNDISPLLCFHFWEPIYYKFDDSDFPSDSREKRRHFVGIRKSV
jgi:hypothetical protein